MIAIHLAKDLRQLPAVVHAEAGYAQLVDLIVGNTGVPVDWKYRDSAGKS